MMCSCNNIHFSMYIIRVGINVWGVFFVLFSHGNVLREKGVMRNLFSQPCSNCQGENPQALSLRSPWL